MTRSAPWLVLALVGCGAVEPAPGAEGLQAREDLAECRDPRPELCTQEYVPVCALRATGVACVTAPCEGALERVTKSNRCTACADPEVIGWVPAACDADPSDSPFRLDP